MPVNFEQYENTIKQASIAARGASSIDAALDIQAAGYRQAFETAVSQMQVTVTVAGGSSSGAHTGIVT